MTDLTRKQTEKVTIGSVSMGGGEPIRVQSMTNTLTADIQATVTQIKQLADAGSELVRITVNDFEAMEAVPDIITQLRNRGYSVPIIGDFHYNGHVLLNKYPEAAAALDKYRINPGNVGKGEKRDENFQLMIEAAIRHQKPVRIGVNWGSLDQDLFTRMMDENAKLENPKDFKSVIREAMVTSALQSARLAESIGLPKNKIILSVKMSDLQDMVAVYQDLSSKSDYCLHLGLTEAGGSLQGVVASSAALSILLQQGIGDTIRMSLTPEPGVGRELEVKACKTLLQSMGFRYFLPSVTSCPGCGRTSNDAFLHLSKDVSEYIESRMPSWKTQYPGVERLSVAVMGCVVNGPGESKYADIGISLPGNKEKPAMPVYKDGEFFRNLKGENIKDEFISLLDEYIAERFGV